MSILIKTTGFIGDILFASSCAELLYKEQSNEIDFLIGFPQPYELLKLNPFIRNVYLPDNFGPYPSNETILKNNPYDLIYTMPHVNQNEVPIIQFQKSCGLKFPEFNFKVYTNPIQNEIIKLQLDKLKSGTSKSIIGYVANWKNSTIRYSEEEFVNGIQFQNLLQHTHTNTRNIDYILSELSKKYIIVPLGFDQSVSQYDLGLESCALYSYTASLIKNCDIVIGQEGGLTNLAAGIGTKCIITTDFMNYLYGKYGRMKRCDIVNLGPNNICPDKGHIHTSPYISDEELLKLIIENV
jgi:hypothetical protein